jgi:hypothetical protein
MRRTKISDRNHARLKLFGFAKPDGLSTAATFQIGHSSGIDLFARAAPLGLDSCLPPSIRGQCSGQTLERSAGCLSNARCVLSCGDASPWLERRSVPVPRGLGAGKRPALRSFTQRGRSTVDVPCGWSQSNAVGLRGWMARRQAGRLRHRRADRFWKNRPRKSWQWRNRVSREAARGSGWRSR